MTKSTGAFNNALAIISILGFLLIFLDSVFGINLSNWQITLLMIVAGVGLMYEGRIMTIKKWARNGIQKNEFAYLFTIVVGIFSVIIGILAMPSINLLTNQLKGIVGLVSLLAIMFIVGQKWVID